MRGGATGGIPPLSLYQWVVGWWPGRGRRICSSLLRGLVCGVCSSLLASVDVGWMWSMACVQGTWWGVGGGVVGGWVGSWFRGVVSGWGLVLWWGVWWVAVFCWWGLVSGGGGVTCGGLFPLDPSLTPPPTCLVGCGSWFGSSLCWVVQAVGWWLSCGLQFFSGRGGLVWRVACLAGCVLAGLFSTWGRGGGSCWLLRFGRLLVGVVSWPRAPWVVSRVGGLFSSWLRCSRWVGRPGRSGSSSPPSFSPHGTRRPVSDPQIRWANSHVKALTD